MKNFIPIRINRKFTGWRNRTQPTKGVKQKMRGRKLSGVYAQRALKVKKRQTKWAQKNGYAYRMTHRQEKDMQACLTLLVR